MTKGLARPAGLKPLIAGCRRLYPTELRAALALVVKNLDEVGALRESLRDLGAQHVHWGARPEDYVTAREALVHAIGALSPSWDIAREGHWRSAITAIIVPMLEGAAINQRSPPNDSRKRTRRPAPDRIASLRVRSSIKHRALQAHGTFAESLNVMLTLTVFPGATSIGWGVGGFLAYIPSEVPDGGGV